MSLTPEQETAMMLLDATHFPGVSAFRNRASANTAEPHWFDDQTFEPLSDEQMDQRWSDWATAPIFQGSANDP